MSCIKEKLQDASMPKLSGYVEGIVTKMEFTNDVWVVEDKSDWDEVMKEKSPAFTPDIETKKGDKTIEKEFSRTESADADTKVDFNRKFKMFKAFDNAKK